MPERLLPNPNIAVQVLVMSGKIPISVNFSFFLTIYQACG
jgi:hypothetical protein